MKLSEIEVIIVENAPMLVIDEPIKYGDDYIYKLNGVWYYVPKHNSKKQTAKQLHKNLEVMKVLVC